MAGRAGKGASQFGADNPEFVAGISSLVLAVISGIGAWVGLTANHRYSPGAIALAGGVALLLGVTLIWLGAVRSKRTMQFTWPPGIMALGIGSGATSSGIIPPALPKTSLSFVWGIGVMLVALAGSILEFCVEYKMFTPRSDIIANRRLYPLVIFLWALALMLVIASILL